MDIINFSIITISYNSERTIERTIQSVLSQTYTDFEYIIVDGVSNDGTIDIVKRYEPLFEGRMKWKSEPDKGIYDAMNKGIKRANGKLIGIVNSDDWLEPNAIENVLNAVNNKGNRIDAVYCGGIYYHLKDGSVKKWAVNLNSLKRDAKFYLVSGVRHPGLFVPKLVYEKIGLFNDEMKLSADADFMLRCYFGGVEFVDINKIVSNMTEGGISTITSNKTIHIFRSDRKILLKGFGKTGISYFWLYYSWDLRRCLKSIAKQIGLYK